MQDNQAKTDSSQDRDWYRRLLTLPADAKREFIVHGATYGSLYHLAGGIHRLAHPFTPERPLLCLCTDDKALLMAAVLASLAGGPRLVLPHAFSRQALTEVMETLSPAFFLTDDTGENDLPAGPRIITTSSLALGAPIPDTVQDPDLPFVILFTGGSTGIPKVWPKTPRNLFAEARYQAESLGIRPDDLFLSTVPPNHIYGLLFSVLVPFISRARILRGVYTFPREILKAAEDFRATVLVSVPVHYRVLKTEALRRHKLRVALSSAGMLDEEDALFFREKTGLDVIEVYGSTETGGVATRRRFEDGDTWLPMNPVAWKIREEKLCVRSIFLSPTLPRDGRGYFLMADWVEPDGKQRFILRGRAGDIVKIGGKRVNLAAVQARLKQMPGVRDAVVVAIPTGKGRQNELAALVATHLDALQLRQQLALVSEAYAVPKRITVRDEIPMTPSGKYERTEIDRILRREPENRRTAD